MSNFVDRPRYLCALGGAVGTLKVLPRTIPIIHAAAGCGGNIANALNGSAGYLGSGYCAGQALPSTNIYEKDIVFGGEERLEEQISNTLRLIDGDLFFVVTGCMVEMIGDDTLSVSRRFRNQGYPVLAAETAGFKGNSYRGYDIVLETLFREYVDVSSVKDPKTVNLWGVVPVQDVFWMGNLNVLKSLLGQLGYRVNTFFGEGETLDNLKGAGSASLNIVVSDTFGIQAAKVFEEVHGVPYITVPLPIGSAGTERFLRTVAAALQVDEAIVGQVIAGEKARYYAYLERLSDVYNDLDLQRYCVIVGDSNYAQALTGFVADDLGWLPELVVITDILTDEEQKLVAGRFGGFASGIAPRVVFDTDAGNMSRHFNDLWPRNRSQRYYDAFSPAFVIGSAFDRDFAEKLGAPHLSVSYPVSNRVVLDRAYAGYAGALRLTEDILSVLVGNR